MEETDEMRKERIVHEEKEKQINKEKWENEKEEISRRITEMTNSPILNSLLIFILRLLYSRYGIAFYLNNKCIRKFLAH